MTKRTAVSAVFLLAVPATVVLASSLLNYAPKKGWLNDPNGLVYVDGTYHLFYQYSPDADQPKNIGWGHAVSHDLVDWQDRGVAIPYDAVAEEQRFSGSAVYDRRNTSGLGDDRPPLVAVYTSSYGPNATFPDGSPAVSGTQSQSIAYSQDKGKTWHLYRANPVIKNPPLRYADQFRNFRDPKVFWYEAQKKWVMVLVLSLLRKALFYSSPNLKRWTYMSEFSSPNAPVNAIWECPDLFEMVVQQTNESKWILSLSIQPDPAAGSSDSVRYFVGHFDGTEFTEDGDEVAPIKYVDFGFDFYAGVTWNNVGARRLMIGWVDNWAYAREITQKYRGGLSLVREVSLVRKGGSYVLIQKPVAAIYDYVKEVQNFSNAEAERGVEIARNKVYNFIVEASLINQLDFTLVIEDENRDEEARLHYDHESRILYIRVRSMDPKARGNRVKQRVKIDTISKMELSIFMDNNTVTLFCNNGVFVYTELLISDARRRKLRLLKGSTAQVRVARLLLAKN